MTHHVVKAGRDIGGWSIRSALALMLACALCIASPAWAQNYNGLTFGDGSNPVQGGPGGGPFKNACAPNAFIVGVTIHSGAWIDSITGECGIMTPAMDRFFPGAPRFTAKAGGNGGTERRVACSPNQYVTGIKYGFTRDGNKPKYLDYVQVNCAPLFSTGNPTSLCLDSGGNGCWDKHPNPGPYNGFGLAFESRCPANTFPDALLGRAGSYVDALAIRCVLRPQPPPPPGTVRQPIK